MEKTPGQKPLVSVIIPARNEEQLLPACIESIRASAASLHGAIEIIVVLNRCTDRTEEVAAAHGCRITRNDSKNLSQIRNTGARLASADVIVTIDADSTMSQSMLPAVLEALSSPKVVGGGVLMLPERWSAGIALTAMCLLPIIIRYGISGGLFYCSKADFDAIGGFDETLASVEDIDFARRLKAHGKAGRRRFKTIYSACIRTSCRKFDRLGDWYFLRHPSLFRTLLSGRNQQAADEYWYDFKR